MTPAELTEARQALGLRRSELARLFETTDRTVRAWENGEGADTKWRPIPFAIATLIKLAVKYPKIRHELGIKTRQSQQAKARRSPRDQSEPAS